MKTSGTKNRKITGDAEARRESLVLTLRLIYKFSLTGRKEEEEGGGRGVGRDERSF